MADDILNVKINPFYVRKMRTYFRCVDQNRSGILTKEDVEALADRYQLLANVDSIREKQARRKIMTLWNAYMDEMAKKTAMTPEVFGKCIASISDRDLMISNTSQFANVLFDLIDLNADGVVTLREFTLLHQLFLQNEQTAAAAFNALDTDKNGVIGYEEFSKAVIDFFMPDGEVEIESSVLFGPLSD